MAKTKTWAEKREANGRQPEVSVLEKDFSDLKAGQKMLIVNPKIVEEYLKKVPEGQHTDIKQMRKDLAAEYGADGTCPLTTGIYLRIASEYAYEQLQAGANPQTVVPFWRAIDKKSGLAKKISFGYEAVEALRKKEGLA